ncbi:hypothetical protein [Parvularcula bermudensis]|uniref:hypothetical protein n=1 Tax=Parvularcula bermudensis TaxID=208216 RepID=UPI0011D21B9B|nr:hypothetical protein [Parvularcula bermudensis]
MFVPALIALALTPLADLEVGDVQSEARLVVTCGGTCGAELYGDTRFFLTGVAADFVVPTSDASAIVRQVTFAMERRGSVMSVDLTRAPRGVVVTRCGSDKLCFDFETAEAPANTDSLTAIERDLSGMKRAKRRVLLATAQRDLSCEAADRRLAEEAWTVGRLPVRTDCAPRRVETPHDLPSDRPLTFAAVKAVIGRTRARRLGALPSSRPRSIGGGCRKPTARRRPFRT